MMQQDDAMSASQLRKRYSTLKDDQLSASQLRSRNAIPGNKFERESGSNNALVAIAVAALLLLLGGAAYMLA